MMKDADSSGVVPSAALKTAPKPRPSQPLPLPKVAAQPLGRELLTAVLVGISLFLLLALTTSHQGVSAVGLLGVLSAQTLQFYFGHFVAYLIPLSLLLWAVSLWSQPPLIRWPERILGALLVLVSLSAALAIPHAHLPMTFDPNSLGTNASIAARGGMIGLTLIHPDALNLFGMLGRLGSGLVIVLSTLLGTLILTQRTLRQAFRDISKALEKLGYLTGMIRSGDSTPPPLPPVPLSSAPDHRKFFPKPAPAGAEDHRSPVLGENPKPEAAPEHGPAPRTPTPTPAASPGIPGIWGGANPDAPEVTAAPPAPRPFATPDDRSFGRSAGRSPLSAGRRQPMPDTIKPPNSFRSAGPSPAQALPDLPPDPPQIPAQNKSSLQAFDEALRSSPQPVDLGSLDIPVPPRRPQNPALQQPPAELSFKETARSNEPEPTASSYDQHAHEHAPVEYENETIPQAVKPDSSPWAIRVYPQPQPAPVTPASDPIEAPPSQGKKPGSGATWLSRNEPKSQQPPQYPPSAWIDFRGDHRTATQSPPSSVPGGPPPELAFAPRTTEAPPIDSDFAPQSTINPSKPPSLPLPLQPELDSPQNLSYSEPHDPVWATPEQNLPSDSYLADWNQDSQIPEPYAFGNPIEPPAYEDDLEDLGQLQDPPTNHPDWNGAGSSDFGDSQTDDDSLEPERPSPAMWLPPDPRPLNPPAYDERQTELNLPYREALDSVPPIWPGPRSQSEFATDPNFQLPPIHLFEAPPPCQSRLPQETLVAMADQLQTCLTNHGINATVENAIQGPAIVRFSLRLAMDQRVPPLMRLTREVAIAMRAERVNILGPGKNGMIHLDVPSPTRERVYLAELLQHELFTQHPAPLAVPLGKGISGEPILCDLVATPHLLMAGSTGQGKSVCLNTILLSLLMRRNPDELRLLLIDPKQVELNLYRGIPHLLAPIITEPRKAAAALQWACEVMTHRYEICKSFDTRNIDNYNAIARGGPNHPKARGQQLEVMPHIVIVVDELADLMLQVRKEIEDPFSRLAAMGRACGLHLIIATQRPSVDVVTGTIKSNFPSRIAFLTKTEADSRTILGHAGAETLLGKGDMFYDLAGSRETQRVQGAFVSESDVERVTGYLRQESPVKYVKQDFSVPGEEGRTTSDRARAGGFEETTEDPEMERLYHRALRLVLETRKASVSNVQRKLQIGFPRAGRLMDMMEERGIVGPADSSRVREILVDPDEMLDRLNQIEFGES